MLEAVSNLLKMTVTLFRLLPRRLAVTFGVGVGVVILMLGCTLILRTFIDTVSNPMLRLFLAAPFYATLVLGALSLAIVMVLLMAGLIDWWRDGD